MAEAGEASSRKRVALVTAHGWVGISTPVIVTAEFLVQRGYQVDLFVSEDPNCRRMGIAVPALKHPNIRVQVHQVREIDPGLWRWFAGLGVRAQDVDFVVQYLGQNAQGGVPYQWMIGFDPGGLTRAGLLSMAWEVPYVFHSLELASDENPPRQAERLLNRRAILSLIQDERRADALAQWNGIPRSEIRVVYNTGMGDVFRERKRWFHERFGLPSGKKIVLQVGTLLPFAWVEESIESVDDWPDEYVLVMHGWIGDPQFEQRVRALMATHAGRVFLSTEIVPIERKFEIFQSADIGLVFYQPIDPNLALAAGSSGKLYDFMRTGVPVIGNDIAGMRELLEGNGCGRVIANAAEIGKAIREIDARHETFRQGALSSYPKYEFAGCYSKVVDEVEAMLGKPAGLAGRIVPLPEAAACLMKVRGRTWTAPMDDDRVRVRLEACAARALSGGKSKGLCAEVVFGTPQVSAGSAGSPAYQLAKLGAEVWGEEFRGFLQAICAPNRIKDENLFALFVLAKAICEEGLPGNLVQFGVRDGAATALLGYVCKRYSSQTRYVHCLVDGGNASDAPGMAAEWVNEIMAACQATGTVDRVRISVGSPKANRDNQWNSLGMIALVQFGSEEQGRSPAFIEAINRQLAPGCLIQCDRRLDLFPECNSAGGGKLVKGEPYQERSIFREARWLVRTKAPLKNPSVSQALVDEFIQDDPVRFQLESQMSCNERFQLYYALRQLLPGRASPLRFIEIGSYAGASLALGCVALKRRTPNLQGFCIEPNPQPALPHVIAALGTSIRHLNAYSHAIVGRLKKLFEADTNYPEYILVDGDHSYEGVCRDILDYYPLLAEDGLMVFHDFLPELTEANREAILFHHGGSEPGIRKACRELMEERFKCEVVTVPLLHPGDPSQTQVHLPIIPDVFSTLRVYRKAGKSA